MGEEYEALVDWLRTFPDFPTSSDPSTQEGALAVAKIVEELCEVSIMVNLSKEQSEQTDSLYQYLKALTDKANGSARRFADDASPMFIVLVNLLDCAIQTKDKGQKKEYIGRMMGLPSKSQKIIMKMIEQARSNASSATKRTPPPNATPQQKNLSKSTPRMTSSRSNIIKQYDDFATTPPKNGRYTADQQSPYVSPPVRSSRKSEGGTPSLGFLSPGTRESPQRLQTMVSRQQREIDELRELLQGASKREEDLKDTVQQQEQKHRQAMMSMETRSLNKLDEVQTSLEQRIIELQDQLVLATAEAHRGSTAVHEVAALKEELAIFEGNQAQLEEANKRLQAAKAKLQELADVKGALLKEQEAHGKAVDSIVNLESEVNHLQPFKRQVEVYRKRAVDAEVRLVECQDCLKRLEKRATEENAHIFKDMMMQKSHLAELRQRIIDDTNATDAEVHHGIGDGISELNPQLKEELARLRNENVRLRAFQSQRSDDAVQQLEESLENAEQRVEQYKANHLTTKETLRQTQDSLKQTEQREKCLQSSVQQLENELKDCGEKIVFLESQCALSNEELAKARESCSIERLRSSSIQQTVFGLQEEIKIATEQGVDLLRRLENATSELSAARRKLGIMETSANTLNHVVEQLKDELTVKQNDLETTNLTLKETSLHLATLHNLVAEKDDEIDVFEKKVSDLETSQQKLLSELEEERSARHHDADEAHKALESTRDVLKQKSAAELKALQENMSALLEDERKKYRSKQEQSQELISRLEIQSHAECKKLKDDLDRLRQLYQIEKKNLRNSIESEKAKLACESQKMREEFDCRVESLTTELQERDDKYGAEVKRLRDECEAKIDELVRKGKHMMNISKEKAMGVLQRERQNYNAIVEECDNLKARLIIAVNEIETARSETDAMHGQVEFYKDKVVAVERERSHYQEENEKFRRQLSSRQFSDGQEAQNRLDMVTKELAIVHEENLKLKRSLKSSQLQSIAEADEESRPYDRAGTDSNAIQQIRHEYEKKLSDLHEEKRELVMKNSAQATDITKTEMKVHECEKMIQVLRSENSTLKHQIQRAEVFANEEANENASPANGSVSVPKYSSPKTKHSSPSKIPRSSPSKLPRRTSPSLDRAKRQKATSEEFLRSRIASLKGQTPPKVLFPVESRTSSTLPSLSISKMTVNPPTLANDVHRLGSKSTLNRAQSPLTTSEAMEQNSSPAKDDPGNWSPSLSKLPTLSISKMTVNPSTLANDVHRLGSKSTLNRAQSPLTISEAMEQNSSHAKDDPGECQQS